MSIKKFNEYDMRDNFSIPVYVGYHLADYSGIKGVDPNSRVAGLLNREQGHTYLDLADFPTKRDYVSEHPGEMVMDYDNKVTNQDDGGTWYACTWSGDLQLFLRMFFRVCSYVHAENYNFGDATSRWVITDYSIASGY